MADSKPFHGVSLCVVGNINRDIKCAPLAASKNLFQDGETSIDWIIETIGGGGANSALAAASLGAKVNFVGRVGNDSLADRLSRTLKSHHVGAFLKRDSKNPTGNSLAMAWQNGSRHFLSSLPASRALDPGDIPTKALRGCAHLLRADIWFSEPMLFGGNAKLFRSAQKRSMETSIDINWDPEWGHTSVKRIRERKKAVRSALEFVDLAHGNIRELMEFADAPDLETALNRMTDWGAKAVVVHMGGKGAGWWQDGALTIEPPKLARKQINITGTGDVLSVCMILLGQLMIEPSERLRLANRFVTEFIEGRRQLIPQLSD